MVVGCWYVSIFFSPTRFNPPKRLETGALASDAKLSGSDLAKLPIRALAQLLLRGLNGSIALRALEKADRRCEPQARFKLALLSSAGFGAELELAQAYVYGETLAQTKSAALEELDEARKQLEQDWSVFLFHLLM